MQNEQLNRFLLAQKEDYDTALQEIKSGRKRSHWMWYIFPQLAGLGYSAMSKKYAIQDLEEAEAYLKHPVLGIRLVEISKELLKHSGKSADQIFGYPDDTKLRSCMTLFSSVPAADPVFSQVLSAFFDENKDPETLRLLQHAN